MQNSKQVEIFELYDFLENQKLNWMDDFLHTIKQTRKDLLELHELYFHGKNSKGHPAINGIDYFLETYELHVERFIEGIKYED